MQLFKRQKFDKSDDNLEYTKQVLTQVTCFNDTMTYVKEQRSRKATAYTLNDPIKDRVIYTGDTLLILTKDKPENTDRLTARASLNGLKLENFDRDALDEYNHTLSDASWEIWKQMNFYGQSLKNHDSGNATGVVDEPVAMVCGTMSLHNYRPDTKFDRNSLCVYMLPDPKKNQPFSENGYSTVYAMSRRVLEIAPMEFVKFRIFPMTSGILNAYHSAFPFPSTPVAIVGPKTKAVKFGPVTEFGHDKLPKPRVSFGGEDKYVFTYREIHGTLRRGTGKYGTIRKDPDMYVTEVIRRTPEDPDVDFEGDVDSDDEGRVHPYSKTVDGTSVPLKQDDIDEYLKNLDYFTIDRFRILSKYVAIENHPINKLFIEFRNVIGAINIDDSKVESIPELLRVAPDNVIGPTRKYVQMTNKSNLFRLIMLGSTNIEYTDRLPSDTVIDQIANPGLVLINNNFYAKQLYRMFVSVMFAMIYNYWPETPPTDDDVIKMLKSSNIDKSDKIVVNTTEEFMNMFLSREPYFNDANVMQALKDKNITSNIKDILEGAEIKRIYDIEDFPLALFQFYLCAIKLIEYFENVKKEYGYSTWGGEPNEDTQNKEKTEFKLKINEEYDYDGLFEFINDEDLGNNEVFRNMKKQDAEETKEEDKPELVVSSDVKGESNNSENKMDNSDKLNFKDIMALAPAKQMYIYYSMYIDRDGFYIEEDDYNRAKPYIAAAGYLKNTKKFVDLVDQVYNATDSENSIKEMREYVAENDLYLKFNLLCDFCTIESGNEVLSNSMSIEDLTDLTYDDLEQQLQNVFNEKFKTHTKNDDFQIILKELSDDHQAEIKEVSENVNTFEDKLNVISDQIKKIQKSQQETIVTYQKIHDTPGIEETELRNIRTIIEGLSNQMANLNAAQTKLEQQPTFNNSDHYPNYDEARKVFDWKKKYDESRADNELLRYGYDDDDVEEKMEEPDVMKRPKETKRFYEIKHSEKEMPIKHVESVVIKNILDYEDDINVGEATYITYDPDDVPEWILDPLESHFKKELENLVFRFCGVEIEPGNSGCRAELFHYPAIKHLFKSE